MKISTNIIKVRTNKINDIIYKTLIPFLLNTISANPQIKKAKAITFAIKAVIAIEFGLQFLKQQNNARHPIFIIKYLKFKYY